MGEGAVVAHNPATVDRLHDGQPKAGDEFAYLFAGVKRTATREQDGEAGTLEQPCGPGHGLPVDVGAGRPHAAGTPGGSCLGGKRSEERRVGKRGGAWEGRERVRNAAG